MRIYAAVSVMIAQLGSSGGDARAQCPNCPSGCACAIECVDSRLDIRLPYRAGEEYRVSQGYCGLSHSGYPVDFAMDEGTAVIAVAAGSVVEVDEFAGISCPDPYRDELGVLRCCGLEENPSQMAGVYVKLEHETADPNLKYFSSYLHLRSRYSHRYGRELEVGDMVESGEIIGCSGNTGCSTAAHLHFHLRNGPDADDDGVRPTPMHGAEIVSVNGELISDTIGEFQDETTYRALGEPVFTIGERVSAACVRSSIKVRSAHVCDEVVGTVPNGANGTILGSPTRCTVNGKSYIGWPVRWERGIEGWTAQNWLRKSQSSGRKPVGILVAWGAHRVTASTPVTASALSASVTRSTVISDGSILEWHASSGLHQLPFQASPFITVAAAQHHSLALKSDGTVIGWGNDSNGELTVPSPNSEFVAIAAGHGHSIGLKSTGILVTWGNDYSGRLLVPSPNTGFVAVAESTVGPAGQQHVLAIKSSGQIVAWGMNNYGQADVPHPNEDFIGVAAGTYFSLGLKSNGEIVGWGDNRYGQLDMPGENSGFLSVAAGGAHSLGLRANGTIVAWGSNTNQQCDVPPPNARYVAIAASHVQSLGIRLIEGDFDGDGKVDLSDSSELLIRFGGPGATPHIEDWRWFDFNDDDNVDLADFRLAQNAFTGE